MSLTEHASRINAPGRAIAYALLSSFLLTSNDAVVKWISGDLAVGEIIFLRGAVSIVAILAYAARHGGFAALRVSNWRGQTVRGACMVGGTFLFVTALGRMPLADVITLVFIAPILIAAVSPFALGEPVGWRRWSAIVCGFVGVIVMLRPGAEFYWAALLPLAAASLGATRDIVTRRINLTESSLAMLFYTTVMETLAGLATAPFGWQMPSVGTLLLVAATALLFATSQFLNIESLRFAQVVAIAPFRYAHLIWAVGFGYLLWGDIPDGWTMSGATIIVASGLFIFYRETRRQA